MNPNPFERTEEEYWRLKHDLVLGQITLEQYEAALTDLMVRDSSGKWWMLGVEDGLWYRNDNGEWVLAPSPQIQPPGKVQEYPPETPPYSSPPVPVRSGSNRWLIFLAAGIVLVCICVCIVGWATGILNSFIQGVVIGWNSAW